MDEAVNFQMTIEGNFFIAAEESPPNTSGQRGPVLTKIEGPEFFPPDFSPCSPFIIHQLTLFSLNEKSALLPCRP